MLSAQQPEGGKAFHSARYSANPPEISFREAAKIVTGGQRRNTSDNLFRQIEKVHDLGDTSAGNAFVCGYLRHGEGVVGIKHGAPFEGDLNRISGGLRVNARCVMTALQVS